MNGFDNESGATERISWRQQLILRPELADIDNWSVPHFGLDEDASKAVFFKRRQALGAILRGSPKAAAAEKLGCSVHELYRLLDRCLGSMPGEEPSLALGLVPEARVVPYDGGKFRKLQQKYPHEFAELRKKLKQSLDNKPTAPKYSHQQLWSTLSQLLIAAGAKAEEYPFDRKHPPRESLRQWRLRTEISIEAERTPNRAFEYALHPHAFFDAMDCFQEDEHVHDYELGLLIDTGATLLPLRVSRFWIVLIVDEVSTAIVGRSWGFSKNVRTEDLLECVDNTTSVWMPREDLPRGLAYPAGAGMPSMIPHYRHAVPYILKLDNLWAHFAGRIRGHLHPTWNCAISYGRPKFPIARRVVEMVIARLASYEHQFPSTTGNNPFDPRRDRRRDRVPVVPYSHFEQIIDVSIATINGQSQAALLNNSPLEVLQHRARNGAIVRTLPERYRTPGLAFRVRRNLTITGHPVKNQDVHVNFCYGTYKGRVLLDLLAHGTRRIVVEYDMRDIRFLNVLDRNSVAIGKIVVEGKWQNFAHDERLRSSIYRQAIDNNWSKVNALTHYFENLRQNLKGPADALRLLDIARKMGIGPKPVAPEPQALDAGPPQPIQARSRMTQWVPKFQPSRKR